MAAESRAVDIVIHGDSSSCPFCQLATRKLPGIGSQIIFLSGHNCGQIGDVVELGSDQDELHYTVPGEPEGWSHRANRRFESFIDLSGFSIPEWAPPVSIEDAHTVHWGLVNAFVQADSEGAVQPLDEALKGLISAVWHHRLPLTAEHVWPMLLAHGWPPQTLLSVKQRYTFGLELLRGATGRRAIKRKAMTPFSSARYEPVRRG